jgi:hypothetical protein
MKPQTIKLLSTIRQQTYESADGKVIASIVRAGDQRGGKERLIGTIPTGPHFVAVHYWDGRIDRAMRTPQQVPVPSK